ncbi:MAG: carboxypeptidase-like regulatory domain-containing protein [Candidatus Pseudobacter hemicellulosilyticus]|uniref:Carboxypeptidase-like regulatory domain-containing protein n=1 Tax=Candidatus Pseudobacter hemicellulosilyticus TaxID=3121375 RepID=A0AAJ5X135_9BACT|nr:MAG: carboxypeptidase-like regulatory domain-containing protein [Pseudobacter sp.]
MKSSPAYNWLIAVPALIFSTSEIYPAKPATIHGNIVNHVTGKSIENAYIYIVSGEEESLSDKEGAFSISTWQELPVTLVIEHPQYKQKKISTKDSQKKQLIRLEPK